MIPNPSKLNQPFKLLVPQHLPTDSIPPSILHPHRSLSTLINVNLHYPGGEAPDEMVDVLIRDGAEEVDMGQETVGSGRHGGKFGVVFGDTQNSVQLALDTLTKEKKKKKVNTTRNMELGQQES